MLETNLKELPLYNKGKVKNIIDSSIKRRLLDIGLTKGTEVEKIMKNYSGNLCAYVIRNAIIGIRNEDAEGIIVEVNYDE